MLLNGDINLKNEENEKKSPQNTSVFKNQQPYHATLAYETAGIYACGSAMPCLCLLCG